MTQSHTAPLATETVSKDPLLQPFKLKKLQIKNRVMSTSHAITYQEDGKPKDRYQLYHEAKAKGGIGLTMFGGSSNISVDSANIFDQLNVADDSIIPYFESFSERIHRHGSALMCQITHLGARSHWREDNWLPTISASRHREPLHRAISKEMDHHDIERVIRDFGAAAKRCQQGGLDGIELAAHSHLIGQFWATHTNRRSDEYGGSLENRCRFSLRILEEVRRQVGDDFIVGLRMPIDENFEQGLHWDECVEIAKLHEATGLVDFFNLNGGRMDTELGMSEVMPGMASPLAPYLDQVGSFRKELNTPCFHACRVADVATARYAIREDIVDMIGMTRSHIADPDIVNKIMSGDEERIRPCIGATYCSNHHLCIHNVVTGREEVLTHDIPKTTHAHLKAMVVGGGPAGLEAARVLAIRGHDVTLLEAANLLGGQVILGGKGGWRQDLIGITDWLQEELNHLGVSVKTNVYAESGDVLAENPDLVVIATGGMPDIDGFDGAEYCLSTWDVLSGSSKVMGGVLIMDIMGDHQAASCADFLLSHDVSLEIVTPEHDVLFEASYLEKPFYLKRFYEHDVALTRHHDIVKITKEGTRLKVTLKNILTDIECERLCDHVIYEKGTVPLDDVYFDLKSQSL